MPVKVLIADDHAIVRDGIRMVLESQSNIVIVGEARNGREALALSEDLRPDVILMDISMPELNGIEATRMICKLMPSARIIIFSMHNTKEHVFRAIQAGARGYILKESAGTSVVNAIQAVMKGLLYFCDKIEDPTMTYPINSHSIPQSPIESLSQREREVVQLVVEGKTSVEIAGILSLSPKSVETYRSRLMLKLGLNNIPALVKFALCHGISHGD